MENHRSLFHHVLPAGDSFGRAGVFWFYPSFGDRSPSAVCVSYQSLPARRERTLETDSDIVCRPLEILVPTVFTVELIRVSVYPLPPLVIKNSWAILSHSMYFRERGLPVSLPVSRSIMSGISVCPPDGSHTTIIIIPIMVRSAHG